MSDRLIRGVAETSEPAHRLNAVKELLQGIILSKLQRDGLLTHVAFHGGTALRLVHGLKRYSEDLDFVRRATSIESQPFKASIVRALSQHDMFAQVVDSISTVAGSTGKEVLKIGIAALTDDKLRELINAVQVTITLEIDLHPPEHVATERRKIKNGTELEVFTLPSLMSGKLHILLTRRDREKGRDWYDYAWYRKQGITPNLPQLQSAIDQTGSGIEAGRWATVLREIIVAKNWLQLREDVRPFLERRSELDELTEGKMIELTPE